MPVKVKDLVPNTNASLRVRVCSQGPPRKVQSKKGYPLYVCSFLVGDETGTIEYSAFGKDVSAMEKNIGRVIEITDGWVKEWNNKPQLSLGKAGTWAVVDDKSFPLTSEILKNAKPAAEEAGEDPGND
ncbi:MAG: hypothetical protein Q6373_011860 [Candidatus Sigynarchaeota archaeon]